MIRLFGPHQVERENSFPLKKLNNASPGPGADPEAHATLLLPLQGLIETGRLGTIIDLLNSYFSRQVEVIFRDQGTLDKYIGDAIMAFWGAPVDQPDHARRALECARRMEQTLLQFRHKLGSDGDHFDIGIGLHTGEAVVGFIGSPEHRQDYTVIGDTVKHRGPFGSGDPRCVRPAVRTQRSPISVSSSPKGKETRFISLNHMGVIMKRIITGALLSGLAVLITACAEESATTKETTTVAQNTATPSKETLAVAQNMAAARSMGTAMKETGTTRSAVELMATPYRDAKPAGQLPANSKVDILERRGGWLKITAQGKTGWAKLHQVRSGEGPEGRSSGEGLAIMKNVGQTGRSGSQGIVATTGIRGMSAEELKNAKPDPAAVKKVDGYSVTASQARDYAKAAGLKEKNVPPLPISE